MLKRLGTTWGLALAFVLVLGGMMISGQRTGNMHTIFIVPIAGLFVFQWVFRKRLLIRVLLAIPMVFLLVLYIVAIGGEMATRGDELTFVCVVMPLLCGGPLVALWAIGAYRILRNGVRETSTRRS